MNVEPIVYFQKAAREFKKRVEDRSKGRLEVQLSENAHPQEGHDHLKDVQNGTYHMGQETVFNLQKVVPEFAVWNLPFLFVDDKHVVKYMNSSPALENLRRLEKHGVVGVTYTYSGGFLHVFGLKINSFRDLKGANLGLEESSKNYINFLNSKLAIKSKDMDFSSFTGPNPRLSSSEIIASTGREIYPISASRSVVLNLTNHRVISRVLYLSQSFLDSLPGDLRAIVMEEAKRAGEMERDLSIEDKYSVLREVGQHNIIVNDWSDEKRKAERNLFKNYYQDFIKRFGKNPIQFVDLLKLD